MTSEHPPKTPSCRNSENDLVCTWLKSSLCVNSLETHSGFLFPSTGEPGWLRAAEVTPLLICSSRMAHSLCRSHFHDILCSGKLMSSHGALSDATASVVWQSPSPTFRWPHTRLWSQVTIPVWWQLGTAGFQREPPCVGSCGHGVGRSEEVTASTERAELSSWKAWGGGEDTKQNPSL